MSRPKTIDREKILDAAERLMTTRGPFSLSIGAVAKEAGITKGGVQYSFPTKAALVDALFGRWGAGYEAIFQAAAGESPDPAARVWAHVQATGESDEVSNARTASLGAALLQTPDQLESTRAWYASRLQGLDPATEAGRKARLAFFATEGVYMLRFFGLMAVSQQEWEEVFRDLQELLGGS
ncbi:TetR/AcrR family transcriptional regulator [Neomegalonema sp.]|uniref:TetR/AcrR family transcriptional regulator n=1 Tax=Neomegalonema sp. TaxID=2039713 RepID=UPI00263528B1|nr:TetR/AcrR family transcriptional regulator [Neomegalonema sp.]MDD2868476.1 TetR/AcrR family transcriptional regulator [Neomegalonema sp.]